MRLIRMTAALILIGCLCSAGCNGCTCCTPSSTSPSTTPTEPKATAVDQIQDAKTTAKDYEN